MEPPVAADAESIRDEKVRVLRAMPPIQPDQVVRGRFEGYREEKGVAPESETETFVALRAEIDSWRWAGVPFFIRTGKRLAATATEVLIEFHSPPRLLFADPASAGPHPNHLRFRLGPDEAVTLTLGARAPGDPLRTSPVDLRFDYSDTFGSDPLDAYERLLTDAIAGDARRFARRDTVEAAWRIIDQVVCRPGPLHIYEPGSWGPPKPTPWWERSAGTLLPEESRDERLAERALAGSCRAPTDSCHDQGTGAPHAWVLDDPLEMPDDPRHQIAHRAGTQRDDHRAPPGGVAEHRSRVGEQRLEPGQGQVGDSHLR
jgi:hypothetical protein